ncbi:uncharacterized protein si:dkey-260g12.1 [Pseudorasbora parva]|uniref:uncharacterized protein si:dkey-260g12.1 n=1 Tax=Pseudorasbora parva TaxID=51549 RepID=UPI00351E3057
MLATVLSVALVMLTGHRIYGLPMDGKARSPRALSENCSLLCPAGYFQSNCECRPCPSGFFTSEENTESSCHRCFQNCKANFYMEVKEECTKTSDVVCRCQKGYRCPRVDEYTGQCQECVPITTQGPFYTSTDVPLSTTSSTISSTGLQSLIGDNNVLWIVIVIIFILVSALIPTLFLWFCRKKEKECFKHFVRQCSFGNIEVGSENTPPRQTDEQPHQQETLSHASTPTNHSTDCSFQQPFNSEKTVPSPGTLGPLHIYGPQTVFVSLLNQFGWDGGEKKANKLQEEALNTSNVPYPQSPTVHLSEEERSRENDFIFFPSQEQGKECHISKEEVL